MTPASVEESSNKDAIALRNVVFAFAKSVPILDIEELRIPRGQSIFLHGPSGSGKTTLLSVISGVLVPQQGSVRVLDQELTTLPASARDTLRGSRIGYIFQGFNLVPYLSVAENIALPCQLHAARRARIVAASLPAEVKRLAHRLDLTGQLDAPVTKLSVGQRQRVAIARAIIGAPALIVADEPTSSLDTDRRDAFLALLTELTGEAKERGSDTTLLFVSHDRSLATRFDQTLSIETLNRQARTAELATR